MTAEFQPGGGCAIRVNGRDYQAANPVLVSRVGAAGPDPAAFSPVERAGFRLLGIRQFMRLDAAPARS